MQNLPLPAGRCAQPRRPARSPMHRVAIAALSLSALAVTATAARAEAAKAPAECGALQAKYPQFKGKALVNAINPHTPGYETIDPNDPNKYIGFDIDLGESLGACLGFTLTYKPVTFRSETQRVQGLATRFGPLTCRVGIGRELFQAHVGHFLIAWRECARHVPRACAAAGTPLACHEALQASSSRRDLPQKGLRWTG